MLLTFVILFMTIVYLLVYSQRLYQEGFESDFNPRYCKDCNQRGLRGGSQACMSCNNCGWCVDPNGYGSCVLGDNRGPYFAECAQYFYNGGLSVFGGNPNSLPYGPPKVPFYQKYFVPWFGGYQQFGNDKTLINPRKYRRYGGTKNQAVL